MKKEKDTLDFLLQRNERQSLASSVSRPWLVVYENFMDDLQRRTIYCALLTPDIVNKALQHPAWDLRLGEGMPGCSVRYQGGQEIVEYRRFLCSDGIEPLILHRNYHDLRDPHPEIIEEFRLFHNAYWDHASGMLYKFSEDGSEEVIGRLQGNRLELRRREVLQFLAIKRMYLAIYVDIVRFSESELSIIPSNERNVELCKEYLCFSFQVSPCEPPLKCRTFSRLIGKVLLPPPQKENSGIWPYSKREETYPEFIIGIDEEGNFTSYSCNPDGLANFFGANPHAPNYLTPVFFRREVLSKYYSNPDKYSIEDGYLRCAGLWGLEIDNNSPDHVIAFLGDLGSYLPEKERYHWKAYNIPPYGTMSSVCIRRAFYAEFAPPESPDLIFKDIFKQFTKGWRVRFGWDLFLPLSQADSHHFDTLRVPLHNNQAEFDMQVLNITKIMIDSLNVKVLKRQINSKTKGGGIKLLELFLEKYQIPNQKQHIEFLRNLQALRSSGVAHRKGGNYNDVKTKFGIREDNFIDTFRNILGQTIEFIKDLSTIIKDEDGDSDSR